MLSLYLIERLIGVNGFCCLGVSMGFYTQISRGRETRPPRRKQEVGMGEKKGAEDPASAYKRAGLTHFLRCGVRHGVLVLRVLTTEVNVCL